MQLVISFDNRLYFRDMIPDFLFIVMFDGMFLTNVGQRSASGNGPHESFCAVYLDPNHCSLSFIIITQTKNVSDRYIPNE
jgi:hypothetical protein